MIDWQTPTRRRLTILSVEVRYMSHWRRQMGLPTGMLMVMDMLTYPIEPQFLAQKVNVLAQRRCPAGRYA